MRWVHNGFDGIGAVERRFAERGNSLFSAIRAVRIPCSSE
jgi:hypothetical protein